MSETYDKTYRNTLNLISADIKKKKVIASYIGT